MSKKLAIFENHLLWHPFGQVSLKMKSFMWALIDLGIAPGVAPRVVVFALLKS